MPGGATNEDTIKSRFFPLHKLSGGHWFSESTICSDARLVVVVHLLRRVQERDGGVQGLVAKLSLFVGEAVAAACMLR